MKILGLLLGLFALTAPWVGAGEWLTVQAPAFMLARGHLVVQIVVEPDPANRAIQVDAESTDSYQSSEVQLDGGNAPRRSTFEFKNLPTGTYLIHARLLGSDGQQRALVVRKLEVVAHAR